MSRRTLPRGLPTWKLHRRLHTWHTSAMGPPPAATRAWRAWRLAAGAIKPRLVPVTLKHPKGANAV
jgi:hypothetical protein